MAMGNLVSQLQVCACSRDCQVSWKLFCLRYSYTVAAGEGSLATDMPLNITWRRQQNDSAPLPEEGFSTRPFAPNARPVT